MEHPDEPMDAAAQPTIAIITGLSGAGRTTAAKVLEDLGYFVIDNMPPQLLDSVVTLATGPGAEVSRIALVIDVRGRQFFGDLRQTVRSLEERGLSVRVLYLEASTQSLVQRYEAGRRVHPLAGEDRVIEGIAREREILAELRADADLVIDTTKLNVHQLRDKLTDAFGSPGDTVMVTNMVSFGFKHGTPRDADMMFDVRFLPNPHWVPELKPYTGLDEPVRDYVLGQPEAQEFLDHLLPLLDLMIPAFRREGKRYLTIAIGCTGGKHRSVALTERVAAHIRQDGQTVHVNHRDRLRE
ncbi:RNase adapter RapZ [Euzebya tangerina]|uniref:RNase adapter RapZ n=1 Tax=Euzebya tangerina TaxID=591198 RepID=UPI001F0C98CC|nr:RNase adapter RapZ [Euzebya tangerina]